MPWILKHNTDVIGEWSNYNPRAISEHLPDTSFPDKVSNAWTWEQDGYFLSYVEPAPEAPPAPPGPPEAVTMRQARLALLGAGMLAQVNTAVQAMAGIEGDAARIEWEYATEVRRSSPLVAGLSAALGLTPVQLDSLFTQAATL